MSRGGRSTKIHAAVDALGNPIAIMLTTGNTPDITVAEKLIRQINFKDSTILADRAYDTVSFSISSFCLIHIRFRNLE